MENLSDVRGMATCYSNISGIYSSQELFDKALEYQIMATRYSEQIGDPNFAGSFYVSTGIIYRKMHKPDSALQCYQKALAIYSASNDVQGLGSVYNALGSLTFDKGNYAESINYFKKSVEYALKSGEVLTTTTAYLNIGVGYEKLGNFSEAEIYLLNALKLTEELKIQTLLVPVYDAMIYLYVQRKDYKNAFEYKVKQSELQASLLSEEKLKQISELQLKFETSKKEKELLKKDAALAVQASENKQQKTEKNAFLAGFVFMLLLAAIIFRSFRLKKQAHIEIGLQKAIIEEKQKEIIDSIRYAKRIQQSLMPTEKYIAKKVSELLKK
jgi:Tfp pilus assembly protein PilF